MSQENHASNFEAIPTGSATDIREDVPPNIYEYFDFRQFLRAYYDYKRIRNPQFSFRAFARVSKMKALSHMHLIVSGKRDLSSDKAKNVADACHLKENERKYFSCLVRFNQCKDDTTRALLWSQLMACLPKDTPMRELQRKQMLMIGHWKILALREMMRLKKFQWNYEWVKTRFKPGITESEFRDAICVLSSAGLITRSEGNTYKVNDTVVVKPSSLPLTVTRMMQADLNRFGVQSIETVNPEERVTTSVTFCLSPERMAEVKSKVREFTRSLLESFDVDPQASEVYQLSLMCFPLTNSPSKENPNS